jgi:hypothetical protein
MLSAARWIARYNGSSPCASFADIKNRAWPDVRHPSKALTASALLKRIARISEFILLCASGSLEEQPLADIGRTGATSDAPFAGSGVVLLLPLAGVTDVTFGPTLVAPASTKCFKAVFDDPGIRRLRKVVSSIEPFYDGPG